MYVSEKLYLHILYYWSLFESKKLLLHHPNRPLSLNNVNFRILRLWLTEGFTWLMKDTGNLVKGEKLKKLLSNIREWKIDVTI